MKPESTRHPFCLPLLGAALICVCVLRSSAQDNYEIQVYGSETVEPAVTMVELHSNFTFTGSSDRAPGVLSTHSMLHETLEITHGFTSWFELGAYVFTAVPRNSGWQWVGSHLRPRVSAPAAWQWPLGASLSLEAGYQRLEYSEDTWTSEIRPVVDLQSGRWYLAFNPVFDHSLKGDGAARGFEFSPNAKVSFDLTEEIALGIEYYGSVGPVADPDPVRQQQHQIVPAIDLNVSPEWEFNFGVCFGLTPGTDHVIAKMILGRRIGG